MLFCKTFEISKIKIFNPYYDAIVMMIRRYIMPVNGMYDTVNTHLHIFLNRVHIIINTCCLDDKIDHWTKHFVSGGINEHKIVH